jgi:hypothetical protein
VEKRAVATGNLGWLPVVLVRDFLCDLRGSSLRSLRLKAFERKVPQGFAKQPNNLGVLLKRRRIVRTAEVTIETEEKTVLRGSQAQRRTLMWCPACQREVEMVTPEQAAQIASVEERAVYGWVDEGTVHFIEEFGRLWICVSALSQNMSVSKERIS